MVMQSMSCGTGEATLREWLPRLWRRIEDAHYSYLETDDSPEKLQQKKKLEDYIMEYLCLAPHECKFRLLETSKVFERTVRELAEFNAHRAGVGWAAIARYAAHLLNQPWRKEYRLLRLYSGFYKHEVEANIVGAETLLHAMGYTVAGAGRLTLLAPICPDTVTAVSRDALVAHIECQIMLQVWETLWSSGANVSHITWADILRERIMRPGRPAATAAALLARNHELPYIDNGSEIYSNIPTTVTENHHSRTDARYNQTQCQHCPDSPVDEPSIIHPSYMVTPNVVPQYMYPLHPDVPQCSAVPMMTSYVPYYYPVQAPYMIPTPVYPPIKHATTVAVNGYPPHYRYPSVPTGQLIELDASSVYENEDIRHKKRPDSSRRNSTSKSGFSDVTLPSLPRSDTQPTLSKAREDGMGTYESWDYVFRNLSSKDEDGRSGYSPSIDRDSRTLDRLDKAHRSKYQPTTLDLEDGLQALSLDHRVKDLKKPKQITKKVSVEEKRERPKRQIEPVGNPKADALITPKIAPDKVKLLTKKDIKERKDVIKQQSSVNGTASNAAEVKKVRKPAKLVASEIEKPRRPLENGSIAHTSNTNNVSNAQSNYDLKAQLIVSLDETDARRSPLRALQNGDRPASRTSTHDKQELRKWTCATCTYLNRDNTAACEMCGKSKRGPEIQPLTSGGRECPACTLVNQRQARVCDACGTSLEHCPTYI